jgi:hypothetical protein
MDDRIAGDGRGDVLDSIRRLVAEETGDAGPLLLTQELRVGGWRPAARPTVDDEELARRRAAVLAYLPGPDESEGLTPDADPPLPAAAAPTALADEDALRSLVAEIVREELRGALGERITRNVRRMIRREIATEMAAKRLD